MLLHVAISNVVVIWLQVVTPTPGRAHLMLSSGISSKPGSEQRKTSESIGLSYHYFELVVVVLFHAIAQAKSDRRASLARAL